MFSFFGLASLLDSELRQVTRFLNKNEYGPKDLWKYVKADVRRHEQKIGGVLIIDDAIEEKPYTDDNKAAFDELKNLREKSVAA